MLDWHCTPITLNTRIYSATKSSKKVFIYNISEQVKKNLTALNPRFIIAYHYAF